MRFSLLTTTLVLTIIAALSNTPTFVFGQQTSLIVPRNYVSDSFYESIGINWGFRFGGANGGVFFNNGGGGGAIAPFGGFDPNAAARFGFAGGGPNGGYYFNFFGGQGSTRSMVTEAPILTLPNGGAGVMASTTISPFVTGVVPVLGEAVTPPLSPLRERLRRLESGESPGARDGQISRNSPPPDDAAPVRPASTPADPADVAPPLIASGTKAAGSKSGVAPAGAVGSVSSSNSSASRSDLSVAEIRRQQAEAEAIEQAEQQREVRALVAQGDEAWELGKAAVARSYYRQALRQATGELRRQVQERLARE